MPGLCEEHSRRGFIWMRQQDGGWYYHAPFPVKWGSERGSGLSTSYNWQVAKLYPTLGLVCSLDSNGSKKEVFQ